ncbi:polysaccharide deacetylase family protein [Persicitalea jodogahamensis]|uniref:Polysaccharide deacetylase n=1 Tax=Persicitalea jodogahamensis TaxID=402147 RepID=A0A8J3G825_9BACT|nr:polysaccharide deacetylase family protein [Persicitalea jodogahamensis]GHB62250.1 polysaccharide deacetylase [Persicitalea jodogahamensis]
MKNIHLLVFILVAQCALAQTRQLCVSVDDLPTVAYGADNHEEITRKLIASFQKYRIPAIGFVNESKLYEGGELRAKEVALLRQWLAGGYELGNHTFGHNSYHQVIFSDFTADVLKGAVVTPPLSKAAGLPWRYFRHPYLHIGKTQSAYDSLAVFLTKTGYTEAPVTIDNTDYLFAKVYAMAHRKNDSALMQRIGTDYVEYMEAKIHFYEEASRKLFDREIPQVLLIHASLLNADYLDDLAEMYQRNGYAFVTLSTALQDTAYREKITKFGNYGISWIDRWALSRGVSFDFLANDPPTPTYIEEAAK